MNPYNRINVITACFKCLDDIYEAREVAKHKLIQKQFKERRFGWFGSYPKDLTEASERVNGFDLERVAWSRGAQEKEVRRILAAAKACRALEFCLTTAEFSNISNHYEDTKDVRQQASEDANA